MKNTTAKINTIEYILSNYMLFKGFIECNKYTDLDIDIAIRKLQEIETSGNCIEYVTAVLTQALTDITENVITSMLISNKTKVAQFGIILDSTYIQNCTNIEKMCQSLQITKPTYYARKEKAIEYFNVLFWKDERAKKISECFSYFLPNYILLELLENEEITEENLSDKAMKYYSYKIKHKDAFSTPQFHNTKLLLKNYKNIQLDNNISNLNISQKEGTYFGTGIYILFKNQEIKQKNVFELMIDRNNQLLERLYSALRFMCDNDKYNFMYKVVYHKYLDMYADNTLDDIAKLTNCAERNVSYTLKNAINILSVLLWGSLSTQDLQNRQMFLCFTSTLPKKTIRQTYNIKKKRVEQ